MSDIEINKKSVERLKKLNKKIDEILSKIFTKKIVSALKLGMFIFLLLFLVFLSISEPNYEEFCKNYRFIDRDDYTTKQFVQNIFCSDLEGDTIVLKNHFLGLMKWLVVFFVLNSLSRYYKFNNKKVQYVQEEIQKITSTVLDVYIGIVVIMSYIIIVYYGGV